MIPHLETRALAGAAALAPSADPDPPGTELAWCRDAPRLAGWADRTLVARRDCYGGYYYDRRRGRVAPTTRWAVADPSLPDRWLAEPLDLAVLEAHFEGGRRLRDKVGLHVADARGTCPWVLVDLEAHGPDVVQANARMTALVAGELSAMGLPFRIEDSDGAGGYRLWILLDRPAPLAWAYLFGRYLIRDHAASGMTGPPEVFPRAPTLGPKGCGGWARLPGQHHYRAHWSRIWCPEGERWLGGTEAIESLISFRGDPAIDLTGLVPRDFVPARKVARTLPRSAGPGSGRA